MYSRGDGGGVGRVSFHGSLTIRHQPHHMQGRGRGGVRKVPGDPGEASRAWIEP